MSYPELFKRWQVKEQRPVSDEMWQSLPSFIKAFGRGNVSAAKASPDDPKHPGYPKGSASGVGGEFRPKDGSDSDNASSKKPQDPTWQKKWRFTRNYLVATQKAAKQLNVPVENILGLAALESGWGEEKFPRVANNFFGLHYPAPLSQGYVLSAQGTKVANFASYDDSLQSFVTKFGSIIQNQSNPTAFAKQLQNNGKFGIEDVENKPSYVADMVNTISHIKPFIEHARK